MRPRRTITFKILLLIVIPLVCEVALLSVLFWQVNEAESATRREENIRRAIATASSLILVPEELQNSLASYANSKDRSYLARYSALVTQARSDLKTLEILAESSEEQRKAIWKVQDAMKRVLQVSDEFLSQWSDRTQSEKDLVTEEQFVFQNVQLDITPAVASASAAVRELLAAEKPLTPDPEKETRFKEQLRTTILGILAANVLVSLALGLAFGKGIVSRLRNLMDNTERLSRQEKLKPPLTGEDEIAKLDLVFHHMADSLAEASRKERAVVDKAVDVICSLDRDGRFTRVNPAAQKIWGYAPSEMLGRDVTEFILPDDARDTVQAQLDIIKNGSGPPYENRMRCRDGTVLDMLWTTHWSDVDQTLFCVAHDLTERKRAEEAIKASEERIRFVMANMPVGLVVLDESGLIELVNSSMEQMLKYSEGQLLGTTFASLFKTNSEKAEPLAMLKEKALGRIYECEVICKDRSNFYCHISLREFPTAEGLKYLAIVLDVTERHEVERFKQEFIGVVSHELRTPLTSISGTFELLNGGVFGELSAQASKVVTAAEKSVERLIKLVNDLLDVEKLESGKLDMYFETAALDAILQSSLDSVHQFAADHGVVVEWPQQLQQSVWADPDRIVQVMVNLLSNAIKYSSAGSSVKVELRELQAEMEVRVIDSGRGIPKDFIDKVFDRFQQVEKTDATKKKGTGLGLAICKAIIEQHGGTIGVESVEGQGSTFWFRLPLRAPEKGRSYAVSIKDG